VQAIASGYASVGGIGVRSERLASKILPIRDFNNWLKSQLIASNVPHIKGVSVMDLCCGKGGDLQKYRLPEVTYVTLVDITLESLVETMRRYNGLVADVAEAPAGDDRSRRIYKADFVWADAFAVRLGPHFTMFRNGLRFNLISCQFALHYAFESEERARMLFQNISDLLAPDGRFVATFVSKDAVLDKLRNSGYEYSPETPDVLPPTVESDIFRIYFTKPPAHNPRQPGFGLEYHFVLAEAVNDIPEYLVDMLDFRRLCDEFGLSIVEWYPAFEDYYNKHATPSPQERGRHRTFEQFMSSSTRFLRQREAERAKIKADVQHEVRTEPNSSAGPGKPGAEGSEAAGFGTKPAGDGEGGNQADFPAADPSAAAAVDATSDADEEDFFGDEAASTLPPDSPGSLTSQTPADVVQAHSEISSKVFNLSGELPALEREKQPLTIKAFADIPLEYREVINLYRIVVLEKRDKVGPRTSMAPEDARYLPRRVADVCNLTGQPIDRAALLTHFQDLIWEPGMDDELP